MKHLILFLPACIAMLISCNNEINNFGGEQVISQNKNFTPETIASQLISSWKGNASLTKGKEETVIRTETRYYPIKVETDIPLQKYSTISDNLKFETKVPICFISYEDGYSIASGDPRIPIVFANTEKGALTDTLSNEGLRQILSNIPSACKEMLQDFYLQRKTSIPVNGKIHVANEERVVEVRSMENGYIIIREYIYQPEEVSSLYGPLMKTAWWQGPPFNADVPLNCSEYYGGKAPAGCVAIALGQIINYHKYFKGFIYNWNLLTAAKPFIENKEAAKFIGNISNTIGIEYGCNGSNATIKKARNAFIHGGYNCSTITEYNINNIFSSISTYKSPVYIRATGNDGIGHAWVLDGYKEATQKVRVIEWTRFLGHAFPDTTDPNEVDEIFWTNLKEEPPTRSFIQTIHSQSVNCNWGQGGNSNGFFNSNSFAYATSTGKIYYQQNIQIFTPKK